jgi:ribosome-associated translation inhibitor RaiA
MIIDTRAIGFGLTEAILRHVESRVESALGFAAGHVVRATVRLDDVNGEGRGGADKRCRIVAALRRHRTVTVEAVDADLYAAIDAAAAKARLAALRDVRRSVSLERKGARRPGTLIPA